jgi:hypothetical protein
MTQPCFPWHPPEKAGVKEPIAAAFARDGMRAAVGGTDGRILVWDLDD